MRRPLLAIAALALLLAGCGDDDDASPDAPTVTEPEGEGADGAATVVATDFSFEPSSIEVAAGESVTWRNDDGVGHTVTAGDPDEPTGGFDEELPPGGTVDVTFDEAGSFPYFCRIHPTMTGVVEVG